MATAAHILSVFYLAISLRLATAIQVKTFKPANSAFFFGDASYDVGNTNVVPPGITWLTRSGVLPYGLDYIPASGRFSNGKVTADFLSRYLGIETPPPHLFLLPQFSQFLKNNTYKDIVNFANTTKYGVNFGTGGAGALDITFPGMTIPLGGQVAAFVSLCKAGKLKLTKKSIFFINMGSGDYLNYARLSLPIPPATFVSMVVGNITQAVKTLHAAGARKFVVYGVGPLGCEPAFVFATQSKGCDPLTNKLCVAHQEGLKTSLAVLRNTLRGAKIVQILTYDVVSYLSTRYPYTYYACCGAPSPSNGGLQCGFPGMVGGHFYNWTVCSDRSKYIFFDWLHPSERLSGQLSKVSWEGGPTVAVPYNVKTLALL